MGDIAGPRVWVGLTYFDEIEHLTAQLELLEYVVDGFIVCEGTHTHQGDPKPLHLDGVNLSDTVIRCVADLGGYTEPWDRENAQRDFIGAYIMGMGAGYEAEKTGLFGPDDILIVVDVDEIVNPGVIKYLAAATERGPIRLSMRMFFYGLDWELPLGAGWLHPFAVRVRDLPSSLSDMRVGDLSRAVVGGGWHISYWGGPERRAAKLRAYAHAEQNNPDTHALIATAHETGIGPNGEELVRVTDLEGVPEALVRRFR